MCPGTERLGAGGDVTVRAGSHAVDGDIQGTPEAKAFDGLRRLVLEAGGIDLRFYKERCIIRRIIARQRASGAPSLQAYLNLVSRDPTERRRLVNALTIHVSHFFRNPSTYRAVQDTVLPIILGHKQTGGGRALRLWSVGCACGEEPYSLAILLLEAGGHITRQYASTIYATDVDPASLQKAKAARYPAASLVHVPSPWRQRYFLQDGDGYRIVPEARRLVFFKGHNILDPPPFGRIDLVVCRNVLIYMTEALQEQVLLALHEALNPGGFMVLGKVEGLSGVARDRFEPVNIAERIYRKPESR